VTRRDGLAEAVLAPHGGKATGRPGARRS
jgi:hypothetical protein